MHRNLTMSKTFMNALAIAAAAPLAALLLATGAAADGVVNVYSYRQPELIKPLLDAFTADTGIKTNVLFLDKGLEEKIAEEGANSPADVILTVDIGRLQAAEDKGVTQPLNDDRRSEERRVGKECRSRG